MSNTKLPATSQTSESRSFGDAHELWIRLSAFLSLRSPNTQDTYMGILREWCKFLNASPGTNIAAKNILNATDLHASAYKSWLAKQPGEKPRSESSNNNKQRSLRTLRHKQTKALGLENTQSNATIAKKFAALRRIYRMFIATGLSQGHNPFDADRVPPPPKDSGRKRPTEMVPFNLVKRIISSPDAKHPKGLRDQAILAVLFGGGLRRSEAAKLRLADVQRTSSGTPFLYLRATKAKKDAQQALPKWATSILASLVEQRIREKAKGADYLFISYTGRGGRTPTSAGISASGIYKLFKHYCKMSGTSNFVTPHSARATAITRLLDQGIPHREVQEFSRHSSIQMVELYDKRRIGVDQSAAKELDFD